MHDEWIVTRSITCPCTHMSIMAHDNHYDYVMHTTVSCHVISDSCHMCLSHSNDRQQHDASTWSMTRSITCPCTHMSIMAHDTHYDYVMHITVSCHVISDSCHMCLSHSNDRQQHDASTWSMTRSITCPCTHMSIMAHDTRMSHVCLK